MHIEEIGFGPDKYIQDLSNREMEVVFHLPNTINVGIKNDRNTCYLNSVLQALFHVSLFKIFYESDIDHRRENGGEPDCCINCAVNDLMFQTQHLISHANPTLILNEVQKIWPQIADREQEDAHEFLRVLLDGLEISYLARSSNDNFKSAIKDNPFSQMFGGIQTSIIKCNDCDMESKTNEDFKEFLLDIDDKDTLDECLDSYFATEDITTSGYKCEKCGSNNATKKLTLQSCPKVLTIQFKRFKHDGDKIGKYIDINPCVDLTRFLSNPQYFCMKYRLVSAIAHFGSSQFSGHYLAIGRADDGSFNIFNDDEVYQALTENVYHSPAYILFLELETNKLATIPEENTGS